MHTRLSHARTHLWVHRHETPSSLLHHHILHLLLLNHVLHVLISHQILHVLKSLWVHLIHWILHLGRLDLVLFFIVRFLLRLLFLWLLFLRFFLFRLLTGLLCFPTGFLLLRNLLYLYAGRFTSTFCRPILGFTFLLFIIWRLFRPWLLFRLLSHSTWPSPQVSSLSFFFCFCLWQCLLLLFEFLFELFKLLSLF